MRSSRHGCSWPLLAAGLLFLGLTVCTLRAEPRLEHRFRWEQANALMMSAATPEAFHAAAAAYARLAADGVRNGPLFYNQGVALLQAGDSAKAERVLLRAERYMGTTPALAHNLRLARTPADAPREQALPWYRLFLFWHYRLAMPVRIALLMAGISLLGVAGAARIQGRALLAREAHVLAVALLILFGSSVGASWHAELRDRKHDELAYLTPPGSAATRKGAP